MFFHNDGFHDRQIGPNAQNWSLEAACQAAGQCASQYANLILRTALRTACMLGSGPEAGPEAQNLNVFSHFVTTIALKTAKWDLMPNSLSLEAACQAAGQYASQYANHILRIALRTALRTACMLGSGLRLAQKHRI